MNTVTIEITDARGRVVELAARWLVVNATSAGGGVSYVRQVTDTDVEGFGTKVTSMVVKKVDHEAIVKEMATLRNKIDYTFRKHATLVSFGFVGTDEQLAALKADIGPLKEEAVALNDRARMAGSRHRIHVAMMTARLASGDSATAAKAIAETICSHIADYKDAILSLDLSLVKAIQLRARNLDKLAVGIPGSILAGAVDNVRVAVKTIREGLKAGDDPDVIRSRVDLTPCDVALSWFSVDNVQLHDSRS